MEGFDGANPLSGVVHGADANFYGAVLAGGTGNFGTAYKFINAAACDDTLKLSYAAGTLNIGFTVKSAVPATWATYLITPAGATKLWSIPLSIVSPAVSFNVPIPNFPNLGKVFVLTALTGGVTCVDLKAVNTAP